MKPDPFGNPDHPLPEELSEFDPIRFEKVREILTTFANTVSSMKIFPSEHASVRKFVDDLAAKAKAFLETYQKLEIGIEEYGFTYMGKAVYRDEMSIKSLPFFFYKDGMQGLFLYQGLDRDEIAEFLDIIRKESRKPQDEGDIVTALWEKDLANIQYFAPDEYLETKILEGEEETSDRGAIPTLPAELATRVIHFDVDKAKMTSGRIDLAPEDKGGVVEDGPIVAMEEADEEAATDESLPTGKSPSAAHDATLRESEVKEINSLIHANRAVSAEDEFLNLMIEIINLETDLTKFSGSLDVLFDFFLQQVQDGGFQVSGRIIRKIQELKRTLTLPSPEKEALLDGFLKQTTRDQSIAAMREYFKKEPSSDPGSFFEYVKLLGPSVVPLAAEIYETFPSPEFRSPALEYFRELGRDDPGLLASLANDARPVLSREIIGILRGGADKKSVQHLAAFLSFSNRDLRLEAIHALGGIGNDLADKILMGFLSDADESLRIEAALNLKSGGDESRIRHLIRDAGEKPFRKKSPNEKKAIFGFLGRTRTDEALTFLRDILLKNPFFQSAKTIEARLAAVAGLESMATPRAVEALRLGSEVRTRKVREACARALINLSTVSAARKGEDRKP